MSQTGTDATNRDQLLTQLSRILDDDAPERVELGEDTITVRTYALKAPAVKLLAEGVGAEQIKTREEIDLNAGEELTEVVIEPQAAQLVCPNCGHDTFSWAVSRLDQGSLYANGTRDTEQTNVGEAAQSVNNEVSCVGCDTKHQRSDLVPVGEADRHS